LTPANRLNATHRLFPRDRQEYFFFEIAPFVFQRVEAVVEKSHASVGGPRSRGMRGTASGLVRAGRKGAHFTNWAGFAPSVSFNGTDSTRGSSRLPSGAAICSEIIRFLADLHRDLDSASKLDDLARGNAGHQKSGNGLESYSGGRGTEDRSLQLCKTAVQLLGDLVEFARRRSKCCEQGQLSVAWH